MHSCIQLHQSACRAFLPRNKIIQTMNPIAEKYVKSRGSTRGGTDVYTEYIIYSKNTYIYIYIHIRIAQPGMQNAEFKYQDHLMVWPWHAPLLICRWAFIQDIQGSLILSCCGGRVLKLLRLSTRCQCMLGYLPDRISSSIYMMIYVIY